jgi:hypothetical protein
MFPRPDGLHDNSGAARRRQRRLNWCAWPPPVAATRADCAIARCCCLAAGGLGSAALVGLDAEHIRLTPTAAEVTLDVLGSEHAPEGVAGWA